MRAGDENRTRTISLGIAVVPLTLPTWPDLRRGPPTSDSDRPSFTAANGPVITADLEDTLFGAVREQAEAMISWAKSGEAPALAHDQLEERALADGSR